MYVYLFGWNIAKCVILTCEKTGDIVQHSSKLDDELITSQLSNEKYPQKIFMDLIMVSSEIVKINPTYVKTLVTEVD